MKRRSVLTHNHNTPYKDNKKQMEKKEIKSFQAELEPEYEIVSSRIFQEPSSYSLSNIIDPAEKLNSKLVLGKAFRR